MVVIVLAPAKTVNPSQDELGRTVAGYAPSMSPQELYEAGRGCWVLNHERATREKYALLVAGGVVQGAIEIDNLVPYGKRYAIEGRMLQAGDHVYDTYVGKESPVASTRNPIRYFTDIRLCSCGCGGETEKDFLPGHDQKAIHSRISSKFRSVAEFIRWFDAQFQA